MNNCPNCNAEIAVGANKCEECGYKFTSKRNSHSAQKANVD